MTTSTKSPTKKRPLTLRAFWLMVSLSFRADPLGSVLLCVAMPTYFLAPAAGAVATKLLVDAAGEGRTTAAVWAGVFAGLAALAATASLKLEVYLSYTLEKKVNALVERRLAEMLVRLPGIEHYERSDYLDEVQQLREQSGNLGAGLLAALNMLAHICQVVVVCALLAAQTPLLLLLPLFALPSFVAAGISNRLTRRASEATAESERLVHRFVGMVGDLPVAREARLFGLGTELRERRRQQAARIDRVRGRALVRSTMLGWTGNLIFAVGYFGAVLLVLRRALRGELTAGDVALTVVLAGQAQGFFAGLVGAAKFLAGISTVAIRMDWLTAYEKAQRPSGAARPAPARLSRGIRLEGLSFRYPGTQPMVLDDVSIDLPAGSVVALVGENGAGKTSLVKLLLRYYEPTSGRILADDADLADIDLQQWRQGSSAAFQDFLKLEFRAGESIGLGESRDLDDDGAVRAAAKRGGAVEVVESLPSGLETQLGAGWEGGVDLSGGQWQRLALARARMRERPLLLVLDEPTAALDAQAEYELFEGFAAAARETGQNGGITLLVTHRFSTVRMADLILVLDGGQIREAGTHEELIARGGTYAELFELQAAAYR
ncbi:ABC transporter ATP-binding protein [Actinopolymorpha alba]|uniref:ABC transporter ATP-binding protein n=1 Tax=Actinopolymorpha alba TaxID=533267 RepID=UPI0003678612|nr:ABC transporter ATP-binding protein [Actinopolymorpha alba]